MRDTGCIRRGERLQQCGRSHQVNRRLSRRKALTFAAAVTAVAAGVPAEARAATPLQSVTALQALERLFSADSIDPIWFAPSILAQVPLSLLQAQILGVHGLFGAFSSVEAAGGNNFRVHLVLGTITVAVRLDEQGRISSLGSGGFEYTLASDEQEMHFDSDGD